MLAVCRTIMLWISNLKVFRALFYLSSPIFSLPLKFCCSLPLAKDSYQLTYDTMWYPFPMEFSLFRFFISLPLKFSSLSPAQVWSYGQYQVYLLYSHKAQWYDYAHEFKLFLGTIHRRMKKGLFIFSSTHIHTFTHSHIRTGCNLPGFSWYGITSTTWNNYFLHIRFHSRSPYQWS